MRTDWGAPQSLTVLCHGLSSYFYDWVEINTYNNINKLSNHRGLNDSINK